MVKDCRPTESRGQLIVLRFAGLRPNFLKPYLFELKGLRAPFHFHFPCVLVLSTKLS